MVFFKKTLLAPRCLSDKVGGGPLCLYRGQEPSFPVPFSCLGEGRENGPFLTTPCASQGKGSGTVERIVPL